MGDQFTATVEDVDDLLVKLHRTVAGMRSDMREATDELGDDAEIIYAGHALKDTGRMARGIKAHRAGNVVLVNAVAKNPETGFDYVAVTRFGHRLELIFPRKARALWTPYGYFAYVRGFRPTGDWAARAWPQVKAAAEKVADKLGYKVIARFL